MAKQPRLPRLFAGLMAASCLLPTGALGVAGGLAGELAAGMSGTLQLAPFNRIYLTGTVVLNIVQGGQQALTISGADRAQVEVEIVDGVLYLEAQPPVRRYSSMQSGVTAPEVVIDLTVTDLTELISRGHSEIVGNNLSVDSLTLEGEGGFTFNHLAARQLLVVSQGAANFEVSGEVAHQVVDAAGAVAYEASQLATQTSEVRLAGAGRLALWVEEMLDVQIAGTASVFYKGSPRVHRRVLGAGRIRQVKQELGETHARL